MHARAFVVFFCLLFISIPAFSQAIHGEVLDMDTRQPIRDVHIQNIYTGLDISTDDKGGFLMAANGGQLLEFKKPGYKTTRVRVPKGYLPPYFRIIIKKGISDINASNLAGNYYDGKSDSLKDYELFKHELDIPKLSGFDAIASPFSALSGKNRDAWRFQDDYQEFEKEKYVDRAFSPEVVAKITGLKGDSLNYFVRRYRPSYEQLKSMNEYTYFNYIKGSAIQYRNRQTPRGAQ